MNRVGRAWAVMSVGRSTDGADIRIILVGAERCCYNESRSCYYGLYKSRGSSRKVLNKEVDIRTKRKYPLRSPTVFTDHPSELLHTARRRRLASTGLRPVRRIQARLSVKESYPNTRWPCQAPTTLIELSLPASGALSVTCSACPCSCPPLLALARRRSDPHTPDTSVLSSKLPPSPPYAVTAGTVYIA